MMQRPAPTPNPLRLREALFTVHYLEARERGRERRTRIDAVREVRCRLTLDELAILCRAVRVKIAELDR